MALQEIKNLDVISVAKIYGVMGFVAGIIVGLFILIMSSISLGSVSGMGMLGLGVGIGGFIAAVILYTIIGFIGGAIMAFIYNIIAGIIGGVKIELK